MQLTQIPAGFDHGALSQAWPDMAPFQTLNREVQPTVLGFLVDHAADPGDLFEARLHAGLIRGDNLDGDGFRSGAKRLVRTSTESVATTLPLAMMMTFSQICSTSGKMCVERIIV